MRRLADVTLILLQWALVALGLAVVVGGVASYWQAEAFVASLPATTEGGGAYADSFYYAPSPPSVLVFSTKVGLIAMGLGAALLYCDGSTWRVARLDRLPTQLGPRLTWACPCEVSHDPAGAVTHTWALTTETALGRTSQTS